MKYNLKWLFQQITAGEPLSFLFFWGHKRAKDGKISKSCLSQWWPDTFEDDDITYKTAEHYMMAEKARLFKDDQHLQAILEAEDPGKAKQLGRKVKGFDQQVWMDHRFDIVVKGNLLKFSQNEHLKEFLVNTGNRILVEASPTDRIWGIGMQQGEPGIEAPKKWNGLNLLGFALMEVRDELQN